MCEWEYDDVNNNLFAPSGVLGNMINYLILNLLIYKN